MEPVLVVLIVFGSILALAKMGFEYKRSKLLSGSSDQGSLGTSELKRMIQEAVEQSMEPVKDHLHRLDVRLGLNETKLLDEPLDRARAEEEMD